ncbi:MAG TPA: APC family permease [Dermatophilaceae bacterium]|nr:APC family permease [Dermatophilaceae bacterium]HOA59427.1 APC family permease [Dermatophilaceae bacterium]HPZ70148.1 APC family permease [Dermatophilaceae bacterium]HQD02902.1 APC family permease [Dermatophilaceae bacterium]
MTTTVTLAKRVLVGAPMRSENLGETLLPKRVALPIFSSDALSSVAYATEAILKVLTVGGLAYLYLTPWVALAVALLMTIVVVSYRQVIHAYPDGGGSYEVVRQNLGRGAGMVVAASLMVDYVMTVAVSVAAGVDNVISAVPSLNSQRVLLAVGCVAVLTLVNLRGVRESGRAFAVPTYLFIVGIIAMVGIGLFQTAVGHAPVAVSATYQIREEAFGLTGIALLMLGLRAFSSGCTALTGVEAISNGVPAFKAPKARNAARTLGLMGAIAIVMFVGITILALVAQVRVAEDTCALVGFAGDCASDPQLTVIAQLAGSVFGADSPAFYFVQGTTALVLVLAANTAYNGFPMLTSVLARHDLVPRQLRNRGDRLSFSNGIIALAAAAVALLVVYGADVDQLLHLYVLGVFTSFTLSQIGMVKHWNQQLSEPTTLPSDFARIRLARVVNGVGAVLTAVVLVIVLVTKFTSGAYLVVIAVPLLCLLMREVSRHYARVRRLLASQGNPTRLPSRVHAVVLASTLHEPTLRAVAFARATRPSTLTALTVQVDQDETEALCAAWADAEIPVTLTVVGSPFRDITTPIVDYLQRIRLESPRDLVAVYLPEYVVSHWWEELLHNQSALRLKLRLRLMGNVMLTSVPYVLDGADDPKNTDDDGEPTRPRVAPITP